RAPASTLFPYTTLFRSGAPGGAQRAMQRQGVGGPALLAIRCDDGHLSHGRTYLAEHSEPPGENAVVVGDENLHRGDGASPSRTADRKSTRLNSSHEWTS